MAIENREKKSSVALWLLLIIGSLATLFGLIALLVAVSLWVYREAGATAPVTDVNGRVTIDGKPCVNAHVLFSDREKGVFLVARTYQDGRYRVRIAEQNGLPLGDYRVTVIPPPSPEPRPDIPMKYRRPQTSGLKIRVVPEGRIFDIEMKSE